MKRIQLPTSPIAEAMYRRLLLLLGCMLVCASPAALSAQTVSFAGVQTTVPVSGLGNAGGVAVDGAGDLFIVDNVYNDVVKVTPSGVQTTVPASGLSGPVGVAVDRAGNVYIADSYNNRVVKVTPSGVQTTVGSGLNDPFGVAVDGVGDVFISDNLNNRVVEVTPSGVQTTVPANGLNRPTFVAVDGAGDVFIADTLNNRVVEVKPSGVQTTVPARGLSEPYGVAVDGAGDVFISDTNNARVLKVTPSGVQTMVPVSGLSTPFGVAVDGAGDVFVTDGTNNGTNNLVVEVQTQAVNFGSVNICPAGQATPAPCSQTLTLNYNVTASGTLGTPKVLTHGAPNLDYTLASGSTCTGSVSAGSTCTVNVTFAPKFAGARNGAVELVDGSGNVLATTFLHGVGDGPQIAFGPGVQTTVPTNGLNGPDGVAVDGAGDVYISDTGNTRVLKVTPSGTQTMLPTRLSGTDGIAVDGAGNVFIADNIDNLVVEVTPAGVQTTVPASGLNRPIAVAVDGAGNVFIADDANNRVVEVTPSGVQTTVPASGLSHPAGVAVDGVGDVFIADAGNNRVVEVTPSGVQTTIATGLNLPSAVAVDGAGDVFIADTYNHRVVEVPAGGGAQTTVGTGLNQPAGVAVDGAGNVFIADIVNNAVLEVNRSTPPSLNFAATNVGSTSSPQTVLVENVGNATLSAIPPGLAVGANFEQVPGSGTPADCTASFSLTPGADCDLSISFKPAASGPIQSAAVLTDNSLNGKPAVQSIPLTGAGVAGAQTITFAPIPSQEQGASVTLSATASSGLPVSFTSLTPKVCTVSGATATLIGAGTCSIQASQAGNAQYAPATPVTQSFTVTSAANFTIAVVQHTAKLRWEHPVGFAILRIQPVQGFRGKVRLSCSGGPAGTRCTDFPKTVDVDGTEYAISGILFPRKTKPGTYTITFTGVSGTLTNSTTATFTILPRRDGRRR